MSQDLDQTKVVIVVFAMNGCPACHDYLPRLYKQIDGFQKLKHPFVIYQEGMQLQSGMIPVMVYDGASPDPTVQSFANQHNVTGLPTTILLQKIGWPTKYEGSLTNDQIYGLLNAAVATNR